MSFLLKMLGLANYKSLSVTEYEQQFLTDKVKHTLVDVRTPAEYQTGHLPNAVNIPLNDLPKRLKEIPQEIPVVVVCASGSRSSMGANQVSNAGYTEVYNLSGGTNAWRLQNRPIKTGKR